MTDQPTTTPQSQTCPRCGSTCNARDAFCMRCGASLAAVQTGAPSIASGTPQPGNIQTPRAGPVRAASAPRPWVLAIVGVLVLTGLCALAVVTVVVGTGILGPGLRQASKQPLARNEYEYADLRELYSYPDKHIGEHIWIKGTVFNIERSFFQLDVWPNPGGFDSVYVSYVGVGGSLPDGIYIDSYLAVYGTFEGVKHGNGTFGPIDLLWIDADIIDR